jgi:hypothetical protein
MISPDAVANEILRKVVALVRKGDQVQLHALDGFPVAIYVTDVAGCITYFGPLVRYMEAVHERR